MLQFCKPQTSTGEAPPAEWDNRYEEELCRLWAGLESSLTKIEDPAWRRWCDYIREKFKTLPNKKTTKKTMGKYIIKLAKGYEHLIIDLLSGMHVCLTTDGWTCNILGGKTEWFAVTAHFYDPDWVLRAVALPMIHVAGRTTAVALLPVIKGAMAQKPSRAGRPGFTTTAIVSDQRPPMPTLCRMFMGQVAMPDGLKQWLCDWGMCASHRVESTVENALKMMVSLTMLIQGCCAVVGIFSQSRPMQIILRETCVFLKMTPLSVIQNVTTRWWSTYALLLRLLYLMPALKVMYAAGHFPKFDKADDAVAAKKVLTDAKTFNEILLICVILEPLMVFQRWVEGERYVTGALLPYYIMCIRDHLDQVIEHPERVVERVLAAEHGAGDDAEEQDLEELRRLEHNEPEPAPPEEVAAGEGGEQGADGGGVPERVADAAAEGLVQMAALIKEFAQNLKKDFGGRWGDRNEDKCLGLRGTDYMKGMMIQQVLGAGLHPGCHLGFGKIAGIDDASLGEVVRKEHNDSFWRHMHAHAKEVAWSHLDPSHVRNRNPGYQKAGGRGAAGGGGVQESGDGGGVAPGARGGVGGGRAAPPSGSAQVRGTNENILGVAGGRGRGVHTQPYTPNPTHSSFA
ncbi:hypothetical protein T484DRAFT_2545595 [Baffinella frigidus]|nr:hypothetical protein T484DRAFT_2545595 [Cryptophyta sp. CCMP2293]